MRRLARRAKDSDQVLRPLMAIAAVLDGASRAEAAKVGGMDRQTLRDWVFFFNEQGPDGLINVPALGATGEAQHGAPGVSGADRGRRARARPSMAWYRWRACDRITRLLEEFGISVSDDSVYRALKDLGFSHVSARPRAYKQDPEAIEAFKKTSTLAWRKSAAALRRTRR